ncbi:DUF4123 domain-containing protein [Aquabacterium lacunae]|uniref:DUF4123 domain-containing protein n=1 Tax=Aquabacterium lacunae TaxID=2528630 RepID=A0A4Q9GVD4_9BURK|nr:DUF4123 domain-containing protein [Aquabacterium lacunae]
MTQPTAPWDAEACIDELTAARLAAQPAALQTAGAGLYLLIDPLLGDPVLPAPLDEGLPDEAINSARTEAWQRPTFALQLPVGLPMDTALAPYLVELTGASDPWLDASVQWAIQETVQTWQGDAPISVPHRVGGWLQSAAHGQALADHLSTLLRLRTQLPTQARYLRLADRRVLGLTTHVLGKVALTASLPLVQHWHWLDAHAAWASLSGPAPAALADELPLGAPAPPLPVFTPQQWQLMDQGPSIHRQMAHHIAHQLTQPDCAPPSRWASIGAAQWQAACAPTLAMTPGLGPQT